MAWLAFELTFSKSLFEDNIRTAFTLNEEGVEGHIPQWIYMHLQSQGTGFKSQ